MKTIAVRTAATHYDVHIGAGLLPHIAALTDALVAGALSSGRARAFILSSPEIWRHWGADFAAGFTHPPTVLQVEPGEPHKRLETVAALAERLAAHGADRDSILFACGGGVLGDMTGFLAAIFMRGIRYVQVPTTLLAQVDSALGGKTGVNLNAGKNLVGAFHHPLAVFADTATLTTLPAAELRAGLQESIKAGIIRDRVLFDLLDTRSAAVFSGDVSTLTEVIARSVQVKAHVVAADERETGQRMLLNFGHTLGHAIESATGYTQILHGEAVAWGMLAATSIAASRALITAADAATIARVIRAYGPLPSFHASPAELVARTTSDKKNRGGVRSFILPTAIGAATIVRDITDSELLTAATWLSHAGAAAARA